MVFCLVGFICLRIQSAPNYCYHMMSLFNKFNHVLNTLVKELQVMHAAVLQSDIIVSVLL